MADNLYCPRCGKPSTTETSYCRTCGLSLDGVVEIVSGDAANAPVTSTRPNPMAIRLGIGLLLLGTVLGMINGLIRDLGLFPQIYGKAVFIAFVAAGLLCLGAAVVFPSKKYTKRRNVNSVRESDSTGELDTAPLADQLSPADVDVDNVNFPADSREPVIVDRASVTEHTTRNLK